MLKWPPPTKELAKKALAGMADIGYDGCGGQLHTLDSAWQERCGGILAKSCEEVRPCRTGQNICFVANKCLCCTVEGRNAMRFVRVVHGALCAGGECMLKKATYGRQLYDAGRAVLRVYRKGKSAITRQKDFFFVFLGLAT